MYNKILVPLDGSEMSECSLEHVKEVAVGCHIPEVILLSVVEPAKEAAPWVWGAFAGAQTKREAENKSATTSAIDYDAMRAQQSASAYEKQQQAFADDYLKKTAEKLTAQGMNVQTCILSGKPAETILNYAKDNGVDIIIMSTHGRGGNARWDFGKIADQVIRMSNAPVLVASPSACRI
jgi:nucleotide-binding universal stress UspA family protein